MIFWSPKAANTPLEGSTIVLPCPKAISFAPERDPNFERRQGPLRRKRAAAIVVAAVAVLLWSYYICFKGLRSCGIRA